MQIESAMIVQKSILNFGKISTLGYPELKKWVFGKCLYILMFVTISSNIETSEFFLNKNINEHEKYFGNF